MEWLLALVSAIVVSYFTARFTAQNEQKRLQQELKLEHSVEAAIIQLLDKQGWELRSFKTIESHIKGFKDPDELRQHLVRAGAIAFHDASRNEAKKAERWGLLKKNIKRLSKADD